MNKMVVYSTRLTYPLRVLQIGTGLDERLQLVLLVAHVHPLVAHDRLECRPLRRVQHEELAQQILTVRRHVERNTVGEHNTIGLDGLEY